MWEKLRILAGKNVAPAEPRGDKVRSHPRREYTALSTGSLVAGSRRKRSQSAAEIQVRNVVDMLTLRV